MTVVLRTRTFAPHFRNRFALCDVLKGGQTEFKSRSANSQLSSTHFTFRRCFQFEGA